MGKRAWSDVGFYKGWRYEWQRARPCFCLSLPTIELPWPQKRYIQLGLIMRLRGKTDGCAVSVILLPADDLQARKPFRATVQC